jgi:hypothetical protein
MCSAGKIKGDRTREIVMVSHFQLQQWIMQIANDSAASASESASAIGRPWTDRDKAIYQAGVVNGARELISTLKLQSAIVVTYN